ncbi:MAG: cytochrome c oxidase subunit II, partial [Xanthomonadales bacterium]|nr:cytochrome c oxidase subunit II [Xanthomonadales bacterium]
MRIGSEPMSFWELRMTVNTVLKVAIGAIACLLPSLALAEWALNMPKGVTEVSRDVYDLHMTIFWVCVWIGVVVFGAMFYSVFAHRKSRHPKPADFHESTLVEIIWTVIPVLILVGMAIPATSALRDIENNEDSDLTIVVTGSQWKWHYRYLDAPISFYSLMATPQEQVQNLQPKGEFYLLDVDNPLVLPTNKKVRFLVTSDDVIHSWWVPDLAVKQDAIPGFINEAWARVPVTGVFRGQCAELCGLDHAYMPVVVDVRPEDEFDAWIEEQRLAAELAGEAAVAARARTWTMDELLPIGEEVFVTHCATCHERDGEGQGAKYPALNRGVITTGPIEGHIDQVMNGKAGTEMQAWAPQLSDLEIAAVITYERNSWDNALGDIVQPLT